MHEPTCYMEINAGNDVNGNPRRAALIYGFEQIPGSEITVSVLCDVIDEGYSGYPEWVSRLGYLGQFPVPVRRYRAYLKRAAGVTQ